MDRNLFLALTLSASFQFFAQTPEPLRYDALKSSLKSCPSSKRARSSSPSCLKDRIMSYAIRSAQGSGMNQFTIDSDFGVLKRTETKCCSNA